MEKKDFFISYNKEDKAWAKWIAGTLEEHGYTVYLQAWDIAPGDDFISRMNEFLKYSKNYIAIWSKAFSISPYCKKEFQTALNEHLIGNFNLFLPIRVENVPMDPLYKTIVYIDLFALDEMQAEKDLLNGVGYSANPREKGNFPNAPASRDRTRQGIEFDKPQYPGCLTTISSNAAYRCEPLKIRDIIILETNHSKKGTLFNRLVYDVFHALGFEHPKCSAQKSGRGVNVVLHHRTEKRIALVESKAKKDKIGSSDINKFAGSVDIERGRYERDGNSVVGYFMSTSGFTTSAIEQEEERAKARDGCSGISEVILLGPTEIARELIQGNMLCSLEQAISAAYQPESKSLFLCEDADLLITEHGWIWVLYYSKHPHQAATHFAFVHADGNQLLNNIAELLLQHTTLANSSLTNLIYLEDNLDANQGKKLAKDAYFKYLATELSDIQFEGMPTDKEAGSIKVNLESIFVPLQFTPKQKHQELDSSRVTIEQVLNQAQRVAILAKPGGGKSTLIRRIALAYAFPERRNKVEDRLPNRNWFPVYIRCRDLGADAMKSMSEIVAGIVYRAEIVQHASSFKSLIEDNLQAGRVLLLIDGLDEISVEQHRICFVNQLRTFVATYPQVHLIITSRETGFRAVAGTLTSYCTQYSIANLNREQIRTLSLKWHQAILDNPAQAQEDSDKVCKIILKDGRIVTLAENPLLLTTLLFVKRWVGYLPTKKCQLYEEMIKLLLVTWNAAAHHRLDLDETEPQLAFVAHYMTIHGQQKISRDQLEECIRAARSAMPELLGYTTITPSKFIDQVEERSSLLIQQGLEENERGKLIPSYEFSHLSFQEYLTAKAVVESWTSGDITNGNISLMLENHMAETQWLEVIPLIAVLLGRQAKPVIEYLLQESNIDTSQTALDFESRQENIAALHLANCVASEVPMNQEILEKAIMSIVKKKRLIERMHLTSFSTSINVFNTILNSKYGARYQEIVKKELFLNLDSNYIYEFSSAFLMIYLDRNPEFDLQDIFRLISSENRQEYVTGALLLMHFAFQLEGDESVSLQKDANEELLGKIYSAVLKILQSDDLLNLYTSAWCIAWSGYNRKNLIPLELISDLAHRLIELWICHKTPHEFRRMLSWGLCSICVPNLQIQDTLDLRNAIDYYFQNPLNEYDSDAAIFLGILNHQWSREETQARIDSSGKRFHRRKSRFLKELGYSPRRKAKQVMDNSI